MIYNKDKSMAIRAMEKSDLPIVQVWRNDDSIRRYFREYREFSLAQKEQWYESMIQNDKFEMFVMVSKADGPVGVCGLTYIDWKNRHADLHFAIYKDQAWIDDKYSNIFYPAVLEYAFNSLGLNKVYVEVYENDKKKINFFTSKGFSLDAKLRNHYFHDGKFWDSYMSHQIVQDLDKIRAHYPHLLTGRG